METLEKNPIERGLDRSMSYDQYRELVERLFANGQVTGNLQTEEYLRFTELNIHRMNKWDKHYKVSEDVCNIMGQLEEEEIWLVISEGWCGDAAHNLPVMKKVADCSDKVSFRVVLRDENPELMDKFLTNGTRSIPKLIRIRLADGEVIDTWGSRTTEGQNVIDTLKAAGKSIAEAKEGLQLWYGRNRGRSMESELARMVALD